LVKITLSINGFINEKCYGNKRRKMARLYFLEFILSDRKFDWNVPNHVFKDRDILMCVRHHMKEVMQLTNQSITLYLKSIVTFLKVIMRYYWNQHKWTLEHWNNGNKDRFIIENIHHLQILSIMFADLEEGQLSRWTPCDAAGEFGIAQGNIQRGRKGVWPSIL
jgi:hypothetical protein